MSAAEGCHLGLILGLFALHLVVPGPNMLYICACAARGGRAEASRFAVGTALGTAFWAAAVALGAWRLAEAAPHLVDGLRLLVGLGLIGLGGQAFLAALDRTPLAAPGRRRGRSGAVLRGVLVTVANGNELVFWSAVLVLGAGEAVPPAFALALIVGVGAVALAFDLTLARLAGGGAVGRLLPRLRRPLEAALGAAFCLTGGALLGVL